MTQSLFLYIYRLIVFPALWIGAYLGSFLNSKLAMGFELRKKKEGKFPWENLDIQAPIWIHCSSGEFEYAKPLIRKLKEKSNTPILVTFFSPSYYKQIQSFEGIDAFCPLPWDTAFCFKSFLEIIQPKALLISRTDLWPEMIFQTSQKKIPIVLFSGVLDPESKKIKNPVYKKVYSWVLSYIDTILCVSKKDKTEFEKVFNKKVLVMGDTRFDQVIYRINQKTKLKNVFTNDPKKTIVCGSTWPEDEKVLFEVFPRLKSFKFILAPHEIHSTHLKSLEASLKSIGLDYDYYSQLSSTWGSRVLIIDEIGLLAELYSKAHFAFIGGSFKKQVHSVMEALAQGSYSFFGPYYRNNREAIDFVEKSFAFNFRKPEEMITKIDVLLSQDLSKIKSDLKQEIQKLCGASDSVSDFVLNSALQKR